ncbi:YifB family Mg chelatase-like AAA ATPase [Limnochorda pilosa]|uniref:Magnesium chelatase n=1 Tax=Limnochorda pilosa TaxID=1555112 RepID=A0A0K2SKE3_LIMPI|nr:YifB family Mg chelatase-like AAA ATPase [Limnochorda pilosa]BAS27487.1 magnesium chelatase [Limnochorda pilosa]
MLARLWSATLIGVEGRPVQVEVDLQNGLPAFEVVGLPGTAVLESRDRVRSALRNSGFEMPLGRLTVNLAPADLRKEGPAFDLPMAVGILVATARVPPGRAAAHAFLGELGLDGSLRPVAGVLAAAEAVREHVESLAVPAGNGSEGALSGLPALEFTHLAEVVAYLRGDRTPRPSVPLPPDDREAAPAPGLEAVAGQAQAKRALEVAAAGGHPLVMVGPPGVGKTLLAERLGGLLPPLSEAEAYEVTKIHSIAGLLPPGAGLMRRPPVRRVHPSAGGAALVGGGVPPRPGEVSLAHRGVLFLDEMPEFSPQVLDALRQPLESGWIELSRGRYHVRFPARFLLVGAGNPCPCGQWGFGACRCSDGILARYRRRLSGPLQDRVDLWVSVEPPRGDDLFQAPRDETVRAVERVRQARRRQAERYGRGILNAAAEGGARSFAPDPRVRRLVEQALDGRLISARGAVRLLRVARTLADLDGSEQVREEHAAEALQYRRPPW